MKQYINLLKTVAFKGWPKPPARENMLPTIGVNSATLTHDLGDGFPLLTTKKMYFKGIVHELLWFLRGDTSIRYLVNNNVHIWDEDAYRFYLKKCEQFGKPDPMDFNSFVESVSRVDTKLFCKSIDNKYVFGDYNIGDLGKAYGYQWRSADRGDQVGSVVNSLKTSINSRYHIIDGWNRPDFEECALMPCHILYQFLPRHMSMIDRLDLLHQKMHDDDLIVVESKDGRHLSRFDLFMMLNNNLNIDDHGLIDIILRENDIPEYYLDLNMYQRSADVFLGVPFNIASMSLLNIIMSKTCNALPGVITWIGGDVHLYSNHKNQAQEQISRDCLKLPSVSIKRDVKTISDIESLTVDDFVLVDYVSHPAIKAGLVSGIKK